MTAQELLQAQFALIYRVAKGNLSDVTAEQSVEQPSEGGNCANWILGHMIRAHNNALGLLGEAPVWESDQLERAASDPITNADDAIDWDTMVQRFLASEERCVSAVGNLTDEQLTEGGIPHPFGGESTRADVLNLMAFHQTYHAGQLGLARRLVGLPGVIGAPQPTAAEA